MSNESNWSRFYLPRFPIHFCRFLVLIFNFFGIVSVETTTLNKLQFQSRVRLSEINAVVPIWLKLKLKAVFIKRCSRTHFLFVGLRYCQLLGISFQVFQRLPQQVGTKKYLTWLVRNVCKNVFSQPSRFICSFCWKYSAGKLFIATTFQLFSRSLSSHILWCCLVFSTTNNFCNFWRSKTQQVYFHALCSRDDIFTQKWNCSSPNNLCKCTQSPSTLSTITSRECNFHLF